MEGGRRKKLVRLAATRSAAVSVAHTDGVSERRAWRVLSLHRSTPRQQPGMGARRALVARMHALSERYPRFGSRQSAALLRSAHWRVGRETVRRRWQREGLQVVQRRGKKRSVGGNTTTPKRATQYYLRTGTAKQRRSFAFAYIPIPTLPSGTSREVVFRSAIAACQEDTLRAVLNDLYRWLVFSNFAGFTSHTTPGTRKQILHTMDVVYPYGGALREAEDFAASYHPFGDTQGAVLYLLMHSQNAQDVNHRLGGILVAVLEHAHFKKYGVPTIDRLTNTALS